jgi:hypothetical protein
MNEGSGDGEKHMSRNSMLCLVEKREKYKNLPIVWLPFACAVQAKAAIEIAIDTIHIAVIRAAE